VTCKEEQVRVIRAVLETQSPSELPGQLAAAQQDGAELRASLARQQIQQEDAARIAAQQLAQLAAALAEANARLKAAGARPVPAPRGCVAAAGPACDVAADQQLLSPAPLRERGSPDPSEGPPTPLSPGQSPMLLRQARGSGGGSSGGSGGGGGVAVRSSWSCSPSAARLAPVRCCSPIGCDKRLGGKEMDEEDAPCSPRSDLSGPTFGGVGGCGDEPGTSGFGFAACGRCSSPGAVVAGARARASAAFSGRLARDNPLFRCSMESRRLGRSTTGGGYAGCSAVSLSSLDAGSMLRASMASLDDLRGSIAGGGAAAFGLAKAQLEIQVGRGAA
jgi:hypothetical protein